MKKKDNTVCYVYSIDHVGMTIHPQKIIMN